MDSAVTDIIKSLGPYAAFGFLALWIIRYLIQRNKELQDRNDQLADKLLVMGTTTTQVLAELRAQLKGNGT